MFTVSSEYHFCAAHRLLGHEGHCSNIHGHNYKVIITLSTQKSLDSVGRIVDFSAMKKLFGGWFDEHWDHKTLLYKIDPVCYQLLDFAGRNASLVTSSIILDSVVPLEFNPTAENMTQFLSNEFKKILYDHNMTPMISLENVTIFETEKNSASWEI